MLISFLLGCESLFRMGRICHGVVRPFCSFVDACESLFRMRRCVMSESSHKCNIIRFHSMNFIIALTAWVCHAQIATFS